MPEYTRFASRHTRKNAVALAFALSLALVATLLGAPAPALASVERTISGHVNLGALGVSATAGEVVVEYRMIGAFGGTLPGSVPIDVNGDYQITGLTPNVYGLFFRYIGTGNFGSIGWDNRVRGDSVTSINVWGSDAVGRDVVLPTRAALSGVVTLGSTGVPVSAGQALVTYVVYTGAWYETYPRIWSAESASVSTDADGRFTFPALEPGVYDLHLAPQIAGYQSNWLGANTNLNHYFARAFAAGASPTDINTELLPLQTVSGTIYLGSTSQPAGAGDATVTIEKREGGTGPWAAVASVETSAGGGYSLSGLASGTYRLSVMYNHGTGYFPGLVDGLSLWSLAAVTTANVTLVESYELSGHVDLGTAGEPAGEGEVEVWVQRGLCCDPFIGPFPTDSDGNFVATGLAAGYYTVKFAYVGLGAYRDAYYPGDGNAAFPDRVRLIADTSGIDMVLPEDPGTINVTVTAQGLTPDDYAITGALSVDLFKYDDGTGEWIGVDSGATTSPSTVISFTPLDPGYYYVTAIYDGPKGYDSSSSSILEVTPGSEDTFNAELKPANIMDCGAGGWLVSCRIGGATRFNVSASISELGFDPGVPVVYIANGLNFPDALSAAPAASLEGGPLLLVTPTEIPAPVASEIIRLHPAKIVVVGGPASVSPAVFALLDLMTPEIVRIGGLTRYEVSRGVAEYVWGGPSGPGTDIAYITTGRNFPDALSAGGAAALQRAPVITVDGNAQSVDAETRQLLIDLGVSTVKIAGGPGSVSEALKASIEAIPGIVAVVRLSGLDRYEASGAINRNAFASTDVVLSTDVVFLAVGTNYPDALSGGALAGLYGSPLYVIPSTCIPSYVLDDILAMGAIAVVVLGGPGSVAESVLDLTEC